jgi:hypothetical protein
MAVDRLPPTAFHARIDCGAAAITARAGEPVTLTVTVHNLSGHLWPCLGRPDRKFQVLVGNRWRDEEGNLVSDDARAPLPFDVAPGGEATLFLGVHAPEVNGRYRIEIDLVQEMVGWFQDYGSIATTVHCTVQGGSDGPIVPLARQPTRPRRFRDRHPRLYPVMNALGLRAANEVWQRSRVAVSDLWDDLRLRSGWPRGRHEMEMHCVASAEVQAVLESCGTRVLEIEHELVRDGIQSSRYYAAR